MKGAAAVADLCRGAEKVGREAGANGGRSWPRPLGSIIRFLTVPSEYPTAIWLPVGALAMAVTSAADAEELDDGPGVSDCTCCSDSGSTTHVVSTSNKQNRVPELLL